MKMFSQLILIATVVLMSSVSYAAEPTRWERIKGYAHTEKEAAIADGKKALAEMDVQLEQIKQHAAQSKGDAKASYERSLAELKVKRAEAQKQLEHMQKSGTEAWQATRDGFAGAYQSLHQAYEKASATAKR